jgi:cytochrome c-type biogenesis protein CcmH
VRRLGALVGAALVLAAAPTAAAADCPRTTLGDVEDEVMCPVCGTPLELATEAPQAQRERRLIERLIARCESKRQIKRELAAQFGDRVLALPDDKGFDLAAYLVPALAVLLGGGAVALAAVRWRGRRRAAAAPAPGGAAKSRLDSDLERYDL